MCRAFRLQQKLHILIALIELPVLKNDHKNRTEIFQMFKTDPLLGGNAIMATRILKGAFFISWNSTLRDLFSKLLDSVINHQSLMIA